MKKILIIEDDRFLAKAYQTALPEKLYQVEIAYTGDEGERLIKSLKPDLIILDILLPVKNGFDILKDIKKNRSTKDIPVIVASNLGQEDEVQKGLDLGADKYIVKSQTSITDVVSLITTLLK